MPGQFKPQNRDSDASSSMGLIEIDGVGISRHSRSQRARQIGINPRIDR